MNFMLPVPDASMPTVEICSEMFRGGEDALGARHVVVVQEHDFHERACDRVLVDKTRNFVDERDDRFWPGNYPGAALAPNK
jgi:hypothetical protein